MAWIGVSDAERRKQLDLLGMDGIEELFRALPGGESPPALPSGPPWTEAGLRREARRLGKGNTGAEDLPWFLGAGAYRHHVPAAIQALASRGEFLTAYTPYQSEASQGTLQAMFEYQSMMARLLGMDVVNASHYDGATALAEAVLMGWREQPECRGILVPRRLNPAWLRVLETYGAPHGLDWVPWDPEAPEGPESLGSETWKGASTLVLSLPDGLGRLTDPRPWIRRAKKAGLVVVAVVDPHLTGLYPSPGVLGADLVCAEGQGLGLGLNFGGPWLGILGATKEFMRKIPGRLAGETLDAQGRRGFVLTLSAREQHIRRERAVSNICSNQGSAMLRAAMYCALVGPEGFRDVARRCHDHAHWLADQAAAIPGLRVVYPNFYQEFVVRVPGRAEDWLGRLRARGVVGGFPLGRWWPEFTGDILVCATEMNTRADLGAWVAAMKEVGHELGT